MIFNSLASSHYVADETSTVKRLEWGNYHSTSKNNMIKEFFKTLDNFKSYGQLMNHLSIFGTPDEGIACDFIKEQIEHFDSKIDHTLWGEDCYLLKRMLASGVPRKIAGRQQFALNFTLTFARIRMISKDSRLDHAAWEEATHTGVSIHGCEVRLVDNKSEEGFAMRQALKAATPFATPLISYGELHTTEGMKYRFFLNDPAGLKLHLMKVRD